MVVRFIEGSRSRMKLETLSSKIVLNVRPLIFSLRSNRRNVNTILHHRQRTHTPLAIDII